MAEIKKRAVVRYENMAPEVRIAFDLKYPKGYSDYIQDVVQYPKKDGTSFFAVTIEVEDAIYLVKLDIKTDSADDVERWLDEPGDQEADNEGASGSEGGELPDDNISQYESSEES